MTSMTSRPRFLSRAGRPARAWPLSRTGLGLTLMVMLMLTACSGRSSPEGAVGGVGAAAGPLPTQPLVHGPFEILPAVRRISSGSFPNQGGNPFAKREVSEFQLRHRGQRVALPGGADTWWRVLRLDGAPRPALLLVTTGFVLATEDAQGRLHLQALQSQSSSLAETQWLDAQAGQPGEPDTYGIEAIRDLEAATRLSGGRWLRLGSRTVLDVSTLTAHAIEPWVPVLPGVPIKSLSREGDRVRAFSPGRTAYVLAASGIDYDAPGQPQAYGLLVVDIARGQAVELRTPRTRFRFADARDISPAWIDHHFTWERDAAGVERLIPRERFAPWPWRSKMRQVGQARWELEIPRIHPDFVREIRRLMQTQPDAKASGAADAADRSFKLTLGGCALTVHAFGEPNPVTEDRRIGIWPEGLEAASVTSAACDAAMRRVAALVDAELATGRHDAQLLLQP